MSNNIEGTVVVITGACTGWRSDPRFLSVQGGELHAGCQPSMAGEQARNTGPVHDS